VITCLRLPVSARHALVIVIALAALAALVAPAIVSADSWPGSRPQAYTSSDGRHRFRTRPPQLSTWSGKSQGTLVTVASDGTEAARWVRDLVNIPVLAFVANDGKHVVTLDTWAKLGYEHALVVYGQDGAVIVDYALDALLTNDEIAQLVTHTMNARRWLQGATTAFDSTEHRFVITLHWGKVIRVALATGTIETAQ
jgi:hypothetical protein